jgi:hypothetical protein
VHQPTGIPIDSGTYVTLDDDGNRVEEEEEAVPEPLGKELYSWDWRSERVMMRLTPSVDEEAPHNVDLSGPHDDPTSEHEEVVVSGTAS